MALHYRLHLPEEGCGLFDYVVTGASLGALGRKEEAAAAVRKALAVDLGYLGRGGGDWPGYDYISRTRLVSVMREAGFALCTGPGRLARYLPPPKRRPECSPKPTG